MKATKAVLFDLDNTLIDFMRMKQSACRAAALLAGVAFILFYRQEERSFVKNKC